MNQLLRQRKELCNMPDKYIISGGGTGGHIFPAIAIANEIKRRNPSAEILFVGAEGKMEMQKVPAAGYEIVGLNIRGVKRSFSLSNLMVPILLIKALLKARKIIKTFQPSVVIGVGGYASGAILYIASMMGIPTLIQEQNSYPGITNKILSKRVKAICVAYPGMERFFPGARVLMTGNPVRSEIVALSAQKSDALNRFQLQNDKFTLLVIGGSLGAKSINEAISSGIRRLTENGIQVIWQTGTPYYQEAQKQIQGIAKTNVCVLEFIPEMDLAYAAADLVVSRAGALAVSELSLVKKPCILVPYPHAAEDHQTHNAMSLVEKGAAIFVKDHQAKDLLIDAILNLYADEEKRLAMQKNIAEMGTPNSTEAIVNEIERLQKA